jgi:hypothetical protein
MIAMEFGVKEVEDVDTALAANSKVSSCTVRWKVREKTFDLSQEPYRPPHSNSASGKGGRMNGKNA